jgi:hypothetical protein
LWSSCPTKGVANPVGIRWLYQKEKDEFFKNSIQAYVEYPEELKQKGKKVVMKVISHAWRTYKSRLVKHWRNKTNPFSTYEELREEDWEGVVAKYELEDFAVNSQYMRWLDRRTNLTTTSTTLVMPENRGIGNKRMENRLSGVSRIHMTNSTDG